jgi:hypothetical protein
VSGYSRAPALAQSQYSFTQSLVGPQFKAACRFCDNLQIDTDGMLAPHIGQTLQRMQQVPVVLAAQDTTEFNVAHLPASRARATARAATSAAF